MRRRCKYGIHAGADIPTVGHQAKEGQVRARPPGIVRSSWKGALLAGCLAMSQASWATGETVSAAQVRPDTAVAVTDDAGNRVSLPAPARRIIALSPALTEMVFAAGGGASLVGVVDHSDYPPAARDLPRVGDALSLAVERVLALRPDLILAWRGGNNARLLERIEGLGVPIFYSRIDRLDEIGTTLERLGVLLGTAGGARAAVDFHARLAKLRPAAAPSGADSRPVRVFYQVWALPPMTINGQHLISDLIDRCGGVNVFAAASAAVPHVGYEAVVVAAPEVILASGNSRAPDGDGSLDQWRRFTSIPAVAGNFLFYIDGDAISRATPRTIGAGEAICSRLDQVRRAR